jgi:hypothetical protein
MKDLGSMNGWFGKRVYPNGWDKPFVQEPDRVPQEYTDCAAQKHRIEVVRIGSCWHRHTCPICNITFDVDSSD